MKITKKQIIENFKHLRKFYASDKDFKDHLFSGEVKIPLSELLKLKWGNGSNG